MMNIARPTDKEYTAIEGSINISWGIRAHKDPEKIPATYPPTTFFALAVMLLGIAKIIKLVAPIEAAITTSWVLRSSRTINIEAVASRL
jgi:hypothetical protein